MSMWNENQTEKLILPFQNVFIRICRSRVTINMCFDKGFRMKQIVPEQSVVVKEYDIYIPKTKKVLFPPIVWNKICY